MHKCCVTIIVFAMLSSVSAFGAQFDDEDQRASCQIPEQAVAGVQGQLATVVNEPDHNGGLFSPNRMWSAVVDRVGTLCSVTVTGDAWPGSRAIAIAKANTANGFSN